MNQPNPLEKVIEATVVAYAKQQSILVYKFTSPNRRSVPDRLFILKGGRTFYVEFKRFGEKLTAAQAVEIERIRAQGGTVYVCDNVAAGKVIVDMEVMT